MAITQRRTSEEVGEWFAQLRQRLLREGPAGFSTREKMALLLDPQSMIRLHRELWSLPSESLADWWRLAMRQYNVLAAVHPFFRQAPRVFLLCDDPAVIGAIFFVMERRRGLVLRREIPAEYAGDPGFGRRVSEAFVDCLAGLHAVDVNRVILGKPAGFLERQVNGWAERFARAQTEPLPQMDQLIRWLRDRLPESPAPTLVHNDYKLDNMMLNAGDPGRVEAVLDWEMATVGDPLVDLGCVMCYWPEAGDPPVRRDALSAITTLPGWFTRAQLVERYARLTGRDVSGLGYYEVFGIFKIAVVLQQIYFRYHRGQTRDERFRNFDQRVRGLVKIAAGVAERAG